MRDALENTLEIIRREAPGNVQKIIRRGAPKNSQEIVTVFSYLQLYSSSQLSSV